MSHNPKDSPPKDHLPATRVISSGRYIYSHIAHTRRLDGWCRRAKAILQIIIDIQPDVSPFASSSSYSSASLASPLLWQQQSVKYPECSIFSISQCQQTSPPAYFPSAHHQLRCVLGNQQPQQLCHPLRPRNRKSNICNPNCHVN